MRSFNRQILTAQPLNVNSNSPYSQLRNIYIYCISAIYTGSATGNIKLQASNDPETNDTQVNTPYGPGQSPTNPPAKGPVNWVDIANSTFTISPGVTETLWNVNAVGYNYVRVVYTDASGGTSTATMNIIFNGKGT